MRTVLPFVCVSASTSVDLFLFRHGIAEERRHGLDDSLRSLTDEGILRTTEVARRLRNLGFVADRLLSSPYLRASQTADLAQQAGLAEQSVRQSLGWQRNICSSSSPASSECLKDCQRPSLTADYQVSLPRC